MARNPEKVFINLYRLEKLFISIKILIDCPLVQLIRKVVIGRGLEAVEWDRSRGKVIRSSGSSCTASEMMAGFQTYYNYIRPHQGIGDLTPAQMTGISIDFSGNRGMTMIGLATRLLVVTR